MSEPDVDPEGIQLARVLVAATALRPPPSHDEMARLGQRLYDLWQEGRAGWPAIEVSAEAFVAHIAARLDPEEDPLTVTSKLCAPDLFLACGCTRGDPAALAAFDESFVGRLDEQFRRDQALSRFTEEIKQRVRVKLLVPKGGLAPIIAGYRGRGPLWGWLRVAAARVALDVRRTEEAPGAQPDSFADFHATAPDPELSFFKTHYGWALSLALRAALTALPAEDGNVLRLYYFEGLSAAQIGTLHKVTGRTIQRRLNDIRERLLSDAREHLRVHAQVNPAQLDSIVALLSGELNLSILRLLEERGPGAK